MDETKGFETRVAAEMCQMIAPRYESAVQMDETVAVMISENGAILAAKAGHRTTAWRNFGHLLIRMASKKKKTTSSVAEGG